MTYNLVRDVQKIESRRHRPAWRGLERVSPTLTTNGHPRMAIFGLGETGEALAHAALQDGWQVDGFSRSRSLGEGLRIDTSRSRSVDELARIYSGKNYHTIVVTFPPDLAAHEFWNWLETLSERRILLGSTSIYQRIGGGRSRITEETPLKPGHKRLAIETRFLRRGGTVVRLAGIYSRSRNPVRWLAQGRVGYEDRQVNLVHRDDIAAALLRVAANRNSRAVYNLADGQEHTWRQIVDRLVEAQLIQHSRTPAPLKREDGFVLNTSFLRDHPQFEFRDFWQELFLLARYHASGGKAKADDTAPDCD